MNNNSVPGRLFRGNRLILSAGTIVKASFIDRVDAAKQAGFDAISLFPQQYLNARRREKLSVDNMNEILAEHNVALDEVDPLLDWFGSQATASEALMTEMAQGLGARSINIAAAFVSDRPLEQITECFNRACERFAQIGLRVDLEFLPWTQVSNLTTALKILENADQPNAGVMFDFWHFFNSGEDMNVLRALTPQQVKRITSLQLNDIPQFISTFSIGQNWRYTQDMLLNMRDSIRVMGLDAFLKVALKAKYPHPNAQRMMKDAMCSRVFPGQGIMPVAEVLSVLSSKGVRPVIGLEVFNLEHHSLPAVEVAHRAMRSLQACQDIPLAQ